MSIKELYETDFNDLFENKRQAVVCFLVLERQYLDAMEELRIRRVDNPWPVK